MNKRAKNQQRPGANQELLLDEIYNSNNPEIKKQLQRFLFEEMAKAQDRALLRVAKNFSYLLPASQQQILASQTVL